MGKKAFLMTFLSLFLLFMVVGALWTAPATAHPAERIVGVKVGDWVKYGEFVARLESTAPNVQAPPDFIEINQTLWVKNNVTAISGTSITFQILTYYRNDTEKTEIAVVDVDSGKGNDTLMFISANLATNARIYTGEEYRINETIPRRYLDVTRHMNHLNASTVEPLNEEGSDIAVIHVNYYWDKATGVLCERIGEFTRFTQFDSEEHITIGSISYKMIENNFWFKDPDNTPPVAKAGPDQTVTVGTTVTFDASGSYDDVGIASYHWDFGDGTNATKIDSATTHIYTKAGTYTVTLTVRDPAGNSATYTVKVTVQEASASPIINIVIILVLALSVLVFWRLMSKRSRKRRLSQLSLITSS